MNLRIVSLVAALLPLPLLAAKGDFSFTIGDKVYPISASCIESVTYTPNDEVGAENINLSLTSECGKQLSQLTRQNIGKIAQISYQGNPLSSALIVSVLGSGFRISSKEIPRVVLKQIFDDYAVDH